MRRSWLPVVVALFVAPSLWAEPARAAFAPPARGEKAMVASAHPLATEAGLDVLRRGGNAVDAAVATAFVISVVEPSSAGIGGGGFLLLRLAKEDEVRALDFREKAPAAATRDMYLDEEGRPRDEASLDGYLSVAVPGTVAGLYEAHQQHGELPWRTLLGPAIRLALFGFPIDESFAAALEWRKEVLLRHPASRELFTRNGELLQAGDRLRQQDLALTLRRIAVDPADFYRGRTAARIVSDVQAGGGILSAADLEGYEPTWREPLCGAYRAHQVCSMPPPSSGGVHLVQMLNMIERLDLRGLGWHHPDALHLLIEAMRTAYADRAAHLGDPAFWDVPTEALTSTAYAAKRAAEIGPRARRSDEVRAAGPRLLGARESQDTSHLTVVDEERNAVSLTFTVNYGFGSGVVVPGTGVLLNDEMDDFAIAPGVPNAYGLVGGEANAVAPGKIPLSSMTPVIVSREGALVLAGGSPGGSTIITTSLQLVLHVVDYDMDASAAVAAPRLHHQWQPDKTLIEPFGLDALTRQDLEARGHVLEERARWGNANLIVVDDEGRLQGAADPRGVGAAAGL